MTSEQLAAMILDGLTYEELRAKAIYLMELNGNQARTIDALQSGAVPPQAEPVAWRIRFRSPAGMIGNYPWAYQDTKRLKSPRPEHEIEPLYAAGAPTGLLRQALEALESCGAGAVEDGGAQWFDEKLVDAAHEAISAALASPVSAPHPKEK